MLTSTKLGSLRALGSCRALAILAAVLTCGQQGLSFKLSEAPIPLAGSEENATIRQAVEEAVSDRLERDMEDINNISNPTMENQSDSTEGLGLAKNLEFLLVKVAQLEAIAEMQQAQANRQQKKIDLQQKEIDSLKAQIGNHESPEGEALLETEEEDAQTRLKEAQEIVKSVFLKHHRQREKGILHREQETASAASSSDRDSASLKRRSRRLGPLKDWGEKAGGALVDGYKKARDKAAWLRDNTISTVEEAIAILSQGFNDFGGRCETHHPGIRTFNSHELKIYFGKLKCEIKLMGQSTGLFGLDFGEHRIGLPKQFQLLFHVGWELTSSCHGHHNHVEVTKCLARSLRKYPGDLLPDMVKNVADGKAFDLMPRQMHILYHVGWELGLSCHGHHNHIEVTKCLAKSLRKYPSDLLPNEVRILEHVGWWLAGNCHGHHNHETIIRCLASGLGRYSSPVDFLPDPLKKVADGKVFDLLPDPLKKVGHGKVLDLLPNELKTVADGRVFDLLGDKVRKIADGKVMDLLPDQLKILFHLGWELTHTCRSHLNHITVSKCLASSLAKFSPPLDFLPDPLKKVAHGSILDLMPQPVQLLAGGEGSSVKTVLTMGNELAKCENPNSQEELVQCLGFRIISSVPPLNFLNRLGDIFAEFVGTFAKVASAVATQAMKGGQSLLQEAFSTDFPKAGAPAVLHHQTPNFVIRKHSQKAPRNAALLQELGDDKESPPGISWSLDDHGPEIRELVTQFDGRETSTGSCLAFAPRNKTGSNNQATQQDWQAASKDDFVKLEPWAVPCTNTWMKDNWKKWQGYSFYTSDMQIERCVTVSFGLDMQPVVAFVGGIQFSLLPKPLAEVNTQVCWPKTQPGGLDLSVLRSEIKSSGILLFSRTLRLTKRFGEDTDFTSANINGGHQTAQTYFSVSEAADAESGTGISSMKRSASLLEGNRSIRGRGGGAKKEKSLYWKSEDADFYVASVDYGLDLGVNTTSESQGTAAEELLRASEEREETFKLFSFKNSGTVNFEVKGLLSGNWLQLGLQMGFGPYQSPEQVIPLVNIVDQFALILMAMPDELVSLQSRTRAIAALKDFSRGDVLETQRKAKENKAEDDKEGWSFDVNSPPVSSGRQRPVQAQEPSVICQGSPVEGSSCSHLEEPDCESYFVKDGDSYMQCAWVDGRCLTMGAACYTTTTTTTSTTTTTTTTTTSTSTTTTTTTSTSTTTTTTTSTSTTSTSTTTTTTTSTSTSTTSTSTTTTTSTTTATTTTSTTTTTTTSTVTTSTVTITSTTTTTITTTTLVPIPPDSEMAPGVECDYFYGQAQCQVPDLASLTPEHSAVLPNIDMHNGRFPHVRAADNFCLRCKGYVSIKEAGNYKFHTGSSDGSLLYVNGQMLVDNNGCHGEQWRTSVATFFSAGAQELVFEMCDAGGAESFRLHYEGPDTNHHAPVIPASALKHHRKGLGEGLRCDYFYNWHHCHVPNLGDMTPAHSQVLPNVDMHHGRFPHLRQTDHFCIRCSGYVSTTQSGNYRFYTASDDGSFLFLNGERIVDNNGCHGEQERSSHDKFLGPGLHSLVVDMCELGGHENFKVRYSGPDTGNHKVTIPSTVLKHEPMQISDGLECDYFYSQHHCHVPNLGAMTPAHSEVLPNVDMHHGRFPHLRQTDHFCIRCSGYVSTTQSGNYRFYTASDDGSFLFLNGERIVDNNGCHGEQERSSHDKFLEPGLHRLVVDMCEMGGHENFKVRYSGPDTGNHKVTIPASVLKH